MQAKQDKKAKHDKKSISGIRFLKNRFFKNKKGVKMREEEAGDAEVTNPLNVERQKKSISMFSGIYHSTISIPLRKDKDVSNNAESQVIDFHLFLTALTRGAPPPPNQVFLTVKRTD